MHKQEATGMESLFLCTVMHTLFPTLPPAQSILRDAVTDLALHYLAKAKIMVVRDIERSDIEFISKTLGCLPIAHVDHMKPEKVRGGWVGACGEGGGSSCGEGGGGCMGGGGGEVPMGRGH